MHNLGKNCRLYKDKIVKILKKIALVSGLFCQSNEWIYASHKMWVEAVNSSVVTIVVSVAAQTVPITVLLARTVLTILVLLDTGKIKILISIDNQLLDLRTLQW